MQQSNQEEVANGRGPARAEEGRGTGQGTSGVVKEFFSTAGVGRGRNVCVIYVRVFTCMPGTLCIYSL